MFGSKARSNPLTASPLRRHALALSLFTLLTLAVTWPLVIHLFDRVPGWYIADNYEYLWKMWWFRYALLDLHQSPLIAPDIFYPYGFNLAHAELTPLHTIVGLPLTYLLGEVAAYNLFALSSFILAGWAACILVYRLSDSLLAGLLAGTLFVLTPYHTVRYGGILPPTSFQGIPLFFLGLEAWVGERKLRWAALAALGFIAASWAYLYYAVGLALLAPIYLLLRLRPLRPRLKERGTWWALALFGALTLAAMAPLAAPYIKLGREVSLTIPLQDVDFWSASVSDYFLPPGLNPLWGSWVREHLLTIPAEYPQIALEFVLAPGFVALLFAFYGWRYARSPARAALAGMAIAAFLLSLGPRLHLLGRYPLILPAPAWLAAFAQRTLDQMGMWLPAKESYQALAGDGLSVPLPALLLRWLFPPLKGMRGWNRFAVFVSLATAVLAGLGMAAWLRREVMPSARPGRRWTQYMIAALPLLLAVFELWPGRIPLQPVEPRPVDLWLAQQPGQFTIMELPLTSALSASQMLYTRYHGKRIAFAYGTYFPYWYRDRFPELQTCPQEACLERLRSWEVRYVLLNLASEPRGPELEAIMDARIELARLGRFGDIIVYRLLPRKTNGLRLPPPWPGRGSAVVVDYRRTAGTCRRERPPMFPSTSREDIRRAASGCSDAGPLALPNTRIKTAAGGPRERA